MDTRQNTQNQKESALMHYNEDLSVPVSNNYFYNKEIQLVVDYHCGVYGNRDIKMSYSNFSTISKNHF